MGRLIVLAAIGTAGYLIYKLYLKQLLAQGTAGKVKIALIALGLFFLVMAATGRAHVMFALIGAAMTQIMRIAPLLMRYAPFLKRYLGGAGIAGGVAGGSTASRVQTPTLVMTLDHASGHIDGEIIAGEFKGMQLSSLNLEQLKSFYSHCQQHDTEALRLLQAYVSREHPEWVVGDAGGDQQEQISPGGDSLTVREAYDILGLQDGASREDIRNAHKSLMTQFHPDKGGSNYLASKINEAKSLLLSRMQ